MQIRSEEGVLKSSVYVCYLLFHLLLEYLVLVECYVEENVSVLSPSEKAGLSPLEMGLAEYEERLLFPGCQKLGESTIILTV